MYNKKETRKMKVGIYKVTNKENGKAYVGQSVDIDRRWRKHINDSKNPKKKSYYYPLCRAFRKYGEENFDFIILEECSKEELNEKEIYWIAYYNTYYHEYNQTLGGEHSVTTEKEKIIGIISDLETTNLPMKNIAKKWDVAFGIVSEVNTGKSWYREDREYPIRTYIPPEKTVRHCVDCGKELSSRTATRCWSCHKKERAKNIPSKERLLYLILRYPFIQIGEMYDVDSNAVRKWCKKYGLPYKQADIKKLKKELNITEWHSNVNNNAAKKTVNQYDKNNNLIASFSSLTDASKMIMEEGKWKSSVASINSGISNCCNNKKKTAYGYIWKFAS